MKDCVGLDFQPKMALMMLVCLREDFQFNNFGIFSKTFCFIYAKGYWLWQATIHTSPYTSLHFSYTSLTLLTLLLHSLHFSYTPYTSLTLFTLLLHFSYTLYTSLTLLTLLLHSLHFSYTSLHFSYTPYTSLALFTLLLHSLHFSYTSLHFSYTPYTSLTLFTLLSFSCYSGTDRETFGFGGTGKKSTARQFDTYGEVGIYRFCQF